MKIAFVHIKNFRKLIDVRIDFAADQTLFVGANNSGKTSAMDALRKFLTKGEGNNFIYNDFSVTNRTLINKIGNTWVEPNAEKPSDLFEWINIVPLMDVWLDVKDTEFHYVAHIIPSLDWEGGKLGVRLSYLPENIGKLFDAYKEDYARARTTEKSNQNNESVTLQPQNLCDFIEKNLNKYFKIKSFILDPSKVDEEQDTDFDCAEKEGHPHPFYGLIKIDVIDAQRGLADADSSNDVVSLSKQLRTYYDKHLDIDKATSPEDLETLRVMQTAHDQFNITLKKKFKDSLDELETLGYPGMTDPKITIESKLKEKTAFEHESAVQYALTNDDTSIKLPEKYNGLGYQNLISITFRLISFRDDRLHKGKAEKDENAKQFVPLHLVLLEEPEAHLHVQVQQVLIKKAYEILTNGDVQRDNSLDTQLVVSTHSSHITKEVEFKNIRYFKRIPADKKTIIASSVVVNLTGTFGEDTKTEKFVQRYLRTTHCDLFFADAVIFVEGTAETVLIPYFIKADFPELDSRYITILPVGGAHSHRFKPLVEKLDILTLVITDLDPAKKETKRDKNNVLRTVYPHCSPEKNDNQITINSSIREWGIASDSIDYLLDLNTEGKILQNDSLMIVYQTAITIPYKGTDSEVLAATFEDSLVYANWPVPDSLLSDGIGKKIKDAAEQSTAADFNKQVYNAVHEDAKGKVSFALELIYKLDKIEIPPYIEEGLNWLQDKLQRKDNQNNSGRADNE